MIVARQRISLRLVTTFHVLPDRLTAAAGSLDELAGEISSLAGDTAQAPVPMMVLARVPEAATLHRALEASAAGGSTRLGEIGAAVRRIAAGAIQSGEGYATADAQVARSYRQSLQRQT